MEYFCLFQVLFRHISRFVLNQTEILGSGWFHVHKNYSAFLGLSFGSLEHIGWIQILFGSDFRFYFQINFLDSSRVYATEIILSSSNRVVFLWNILSLLQISFSHISGFFFQTSFLGLVWLVCPLKLFCLFRFGLCFASVEYFCGTYVWLGQI